MAKLPPGAVPDTTISPVVPYEQNSGPGDVDERGVPRRIITNETQRSTTHVPSLGESMAHDMLPSALAMAGSVVAPQFAPALRVAPRFMGLLRTGGAGAGGFTGELLGQASMGENLDPNKALSRGLLETGYQAGGEALGGLANKYTGDTYERLFRTTQNEADAMRRTEGRILGAPVQYDDVTAADFARRNKIAVGRGPMGGPDAEMSLGLLRQGPTERLSSAVGHADVSGVTIKPRDLAKAVDDLRAEVDGFVGSSGVGDSFSDLWKAELRDKFQVPTTKRVKRGGKWVQQTNYSDIEISPGQLQDYVQKWYTQGEAWMEKVNRGVSVSPVDESKGRLALALARRGREILREIDAPMPGAPGTPTVTAGQQIGSANDELSRLHGMEGPMKRADFRASTGTATGSRLGLAGHTALTVGPAAAGAALGHGLPGAAAGLTAGLTVEAFINMVRNPAFASRLGLILDDPGVQRWILQQGPREMAMIMSALEMRNQAQRTRSSALPDATNQPGGSR